jgi:hypothetical protein
VNSGTEEVLDGALLVSQEAWISHGRGGAPRPGDEKIQIPIVIRVGPGGAQRSPLPGHPGLGGDVTVGSVPLIVKQTASAAAGDVEIRMRIVVVISESCRAAPGPIEVRRSGGVGESTGSIVAQQDRGRSGPGAVAPGDEEVHIAVRVLVFSGDPRAEGTGSGLQGGSLSIAAVNDDEVRVDGS